MENEMHDKPEKNGNATTALVLGIISLVSVFTIHLTLVGVVLGIIGIVLSGSLKATYQEAKTGFILSIIGLSINAVKLFFLGGFFVLPFLAMI